MDEVGDVLDGLVAQITEREVELVAHLFENDGRETDPPGFGQALQAGGDVDAAAVDTPTCLPLARARRTLGTALQCRGRRCSNPTVGSYSTAIGM